MGQRMFVAIFPPEEIRRELQGVLGEHPDAGWVDPDRWHITLAFCEAVSPRRVDELAESVVAAVTRAGPFTLRLAGGGAFPSESRPRVVWAGVEQQDGETGGDLLAALAEAVRSAAARAGAAPDRAAFRPHLTLARTRDRDEVRRRLAQLESFRGRWWTAEEVVLVASYPGEGGDGGTRYEVVEHARLGYGDTRDGADTGT